MKNDYLTLNARHDNFVRDREQLSKEAMLQNAEMLLQDIREAGKHISEPEQRSILAGMARDLGSTVFGISGIYPAVRLKQPAERIEDAIEFVDRFSEIQFITNLYCPPYLLIHAPAGYGKTRLVQEVRSQLEKQNWFCISVQLWRQKKYLLKDLAYNILRQLGESEEPAENSPEAYGLKVGRFILPKLHKTQKNVIILIDETESVDKEAAKQFLNQFIPSLYQVFAGPGTPVRLRFILAGRSVSHWKIPNAAISPAVMMIAPFDFSAVCQTAENFSAKSNLDLPFDYKQQIASHLMYFTGGHPGCIAKILSKDLGMPAGLFSSYEDKYFETIIGPLAEEIREHIPGDLRDIFDTLSPVRRFNAPLLRSFMDGGLIKRSKDEYELEARLVQTYLVNRKDGFLQDDTARSLLSVYLRKTNFSHFLEVCEQAVGFYESRLKDAKLHRPDMIAVELLFQKLHYIFYKLNGNKDDFFKELPEIFNWLITGREPGTVLESLKNCLNDDREFRFTFNYLFREPVYDNDYPFNELIEKTDAFMKNLQECRQYL